jgi:N-acetylglucosaminyldiphosphoundecaprenol N-acetyl-beta-D-mannosaminyltransferase
VGTARDLGKYNVLGVCVDAVDYEGAEERVLAAARDNRPFAGTALAVHGVMSGASDLGQRYRLNHLDLVTPDGQPVRWALRLLHRIELEDRVYGPALTLRLLHRAADEEVPVYFYGSREAVLTSLVQNLRRLVPTLLVAGTEPSKFRPVTSRERSEIALRIAASGARITFVGLGCPRQETFVYEFRPLLDMPLLAVGAAFDYLAGTLKRPPARLQDAGLEWLWRLALEPRRLWRRYVLLNPTYLSLLAAQALGLWHPDPSGVPPPSDVPVAA